MQAKTAEKTGSDVSLRDLAPGDRPVRPVLVTGIRPTGTLHVGNLIGAMHGLQHYQAHYRCHYFVADIHALTTYRGPDKAADGDPLLVRTLHVARTYLAAGLDPGRTLLYRQSGVAAHVCELFTYLAMATPLGELLRCPTFKEKTRRQPHNVNLGLVSYPVLMAADILLLNAEVVPVGEDQLVHLELAREIVRRFNGRYGPVFQEPRPLPENAVRVPSLTGNGKMSKSGTKESAILVTDTPEQIRQKVGGAFSDPLRVDRHLPGHPTPDGCNVFHLHTFFTRYHERERIAHRCLAAEIGCVECKQHLAGSLMTFLGPIQEAAERLTDDDVLEVLEDGERRVRSRAEATIVRVREAIGLRMV